MQLLEEGARAPCRRLSKRQVYFEKGDREQLWDSEVRLPISFASDTSFVLGSITYIPVLGNQALGSRAAGERCSWSVGPSLGAPEQGTGRGGSLVPARRPPPAGGSAARSWRPRGPDSSSSTAARGSPTVASFRRPRSSKHSPLSLSVPRLRPPPQLGAGPEVGSSRGSLLFWLFGAFWDHPGPCVLTEPQGFASYLVGKRPRPDLHSSVKIRTTEFPAMWD